jgi:hypothetical protein
LHPSPPLRWRSAAPQVLLDDHLLGHAEAGQRRSCRVPDIELVVEIDRILSFVAISISRRVDTVSSVTRRCPHHQPAGFHFGQRALENPPLQVVVRSSQLSCMTTNWPSFERLTSISTISAPIAIEPTAAGVLRIERLAGLHAAGAVH